MTPTRNLLYTKFSSKILFVEGSTSISQKRDGMFNRSELQPIVMEEKNFNNFKSYVHICQGMLREFFTKILDRVF